MFAARTLKQGLNYLLRECFIVAVVVAVVFFFFVFVCFFFFFFCFVFVLFLLFLLFVFCLLSVFYPKTHFEDVCRRLWHFWLVLSHISSKLFESSLIWNTKPCYFPFKTRFK